MFKFKRLISVFLATILVSSLLCIPSFAQSINSENQFLDNNIKMAYIPSVNETGSNLLNYSFDQGKYDIDVNILTTAGYNNIGQLNLAGIYLGKEFNVTAEYIGKNENGNICVFTGTDIKGIYDVAYCAIEKNISKSILYFTNMANQSDTVLKLYLRDKNNNSFILIEIFDVPFPNTNQRAVISDNEVNVHSSQQLLMKLKMKYQPLPQIAMRPKP